jgi:hypothetical protein
MAKEIFSVTITHPFEQSSEGAINVSIGFNEQEMIANINSLLASKNLKYRGDSALSYQYNNDGSVTITGIAGTFNSNAPDITYV